MIENRYFVVNVPNPNMSQIYDIAVQSETSIRLSNDGTQGIVKLPVGDQRDYAVLNSATEYTHAGIKQHLKDNATDWSTESEI